MLTILIISFFLLLIYTIIILIDLFYRLREGGGEND